MNEKIEQMIERMVEKTKAFPESKWYPVFKICLIPIVVLYYMCEYLFFVFGFLGLLFCFSGLVNFHDTIPPKLFEIMMYVALITFVLGEAALLFVGSKKGILRYVIGIFRKDEIPRDAHVTKVIKYAVPYQRAEENTNRDSEEDVYHGN